MDTAVFALLTSRQQITDIIDDRVYPINRDQDDEIPAITYRGVSSVRDYTDDGMIKLLDQSYDLNLYAESYSQLQQLSDEIENLSGISGDFSTYNIRYVMIREIGDDDLIDLSDQRVYTKQIEIKITLEKI